MLDQEERKPLINQMSETAEKQKDVFRDDRQPVTELVHLDAVDPSVPKGRRLCSRGCPAFSGLTEMSSGGLRNKKDV